MLGDWSAARSPTPLFGSASEGKRSRWPDKTPPCRSPPMRKTKPRLADDGRAVPPRGRGTRCCRKDASWTRFRGFDLQFEQAITAEVESARTGRSGNERECHPMPFLRRTGRRGSGKPPSKNLLDHILELATFSNRSQLHLTNQVVGQIDRCFHLSIFPFFQFPVKLGFWTLFSVVPYRFFSRFPFPPPNSSALDGSCSGFDVGIRAPTSFRQIASTSRNSVVLSGCFAARLFVSPRSAERS